MNVYSPNMVIIGFDPSPNDHNFDRKHGVFVRQTAAGELGWRFLASWSMEDIPMGVTRIQVLFIAISGNFRTLKWRSCDEANIEFYIIYVIYLLGISA